MSKQVDPYEELERAECVRIDERAEADKRTVREYYAFKRRMFPQAPYEPANCPVVAPASQKAAFTGEIGRVSTRVQDNIQSFMDEVKAWPTDEFTFPDINRKLAEKGKKLSADQLRTIWENIVGKQVSLVSARRGSVAAVFSRKMLSSDLPQSEQSAKRADTAKAASAPEQTETGVGSTS